jgi:hypothetical protein
MGADIRINPPVDWIPSKDASMARNSVPIRSWSRLGRQRGWLLVLIFGLAFGVGLSLPPRCQAARLGAYLTAQDRARPVLLSETGTPIPHRSWTHPDKGTVPAYLAFPLGGGEHLPSGTPTLTTAPQADGTTVGPLNLNPLIQGELNTALNTSRIAVIATPTRSYAVEYLPRFARSHSHLGSSAGPSPSGAGSTSGSQSNMPAPSSPSTAQSATPIDPSIQGIPLSELERWAKQGSSQLVHWTTIGVNDLAKSFGAGNSRGTTPKPSSNLAAQVLAPPLADESSASLPLPAPVPEPTSWLVFGLILGGVALRRWVTAPGKPAPAR